MTVCMPPDWVRVDCSRRAIVSFLEGYQHAEIAGMMAAELLENAVKYGSGRDPLELSLGYGDGSVRIEVANAPGSVPEHAERMAARLQWIASCISSEEAYYQLLSAASEGTQKASSVGADSGGVGLARIAYEGNASILAFSDSKGRFHVVVESKVDN